MDPFLRLPEDIFIEILKHFDVHERLFSLSLVSSQWYETIGKSNICMQNIKVNLRSKRKTDFDERIETLKWMSRKNARQYQHIQVNCLLAENVSQEFYSFLTNCYSIETLFVRSMKLDSEVELSNLSLPKLEYLKVMFIPRSAVNKLLVSTSNLRRLILWNENPLSYDELNYLPDQNTLEDVKQCMSSNVKLEELEIQGRANFFAFFQQDISKSAQCELKKLTVKIEMKPELLTESQEKNFISFLRSNADSLEYIYIDKCSTSVIQYVFNKMPNLKTIRFDILLDESNKLDIKELNLRVNQKITNFELPYVKLFDDLKDFLMLVPNVKSILIGHVIPRVLNYATESLSCLESLTFRYDDCAGGCERLYENMKKGNMEINQNINLNVCNDFL